MMEYVPCVSSLFMYKCVVFNGDTFTKFRSIDAIYGKAGMKQNYRIRISFFFSFCFEIHLIWRKIWIKMCYTSYARLYQYECEKSSKRRIWLNNFHFLYCMYQLYLYHLTVHCTMYLYIVPLDWQIFRHSIDLPHPKTCVAIVATMATAVVTPTVHRLILNVWPALSGAVEFVAGFLSSGIRILKNL